MTRDIMEKHPVAGGRLSGILHDSRGPDGGERASEFPPGYTGYVPRRSATNFKRTMQLPSDDLMPREKALPERLFARSKHRQVPSYCSFLNPMNYGMSVREMSDLDPRKTFVPGYTGYYTGKAFDLGVTHSHGANQDLCDSTGALLARSVADQRPKTVDWYSAEWAGASRSPCKVDLEGYDPPPFRATRPVPGYTGHVPGHRDYGHGRTFGSFAHMFERERDLAL